MKAGKRFQVARIGRNSQPRPKIVKISNTNILTRQLCSQLMFSMTFDVNSISSSKISSFKSLPSLFPIMRLFITFPATHCSSLPHFPPHRQLLTEGIWEKSHYLVETMRILLIKKSYNITAHRPTIRKHTNTFQYTYMHVSLLPQHTESQITMLYSRVHPQR